MRIKPLLFAVFFLVSGASSAHAQSIVDPTILEFDPSPDHSVLSASGSPVVAGYELRILPSGTSQVIQALPLGKPDVGTDGKIHLSLSAILDAYPAAGRVYEASVAVVGSGGISVSSSSNTFEFSACDYAVTPDTQTVTADAGGFAVVISARSGCTWTAGAGPGWFSLSGAGLGNGAGVVTYALQANPGGSERSATITVAGHVVSVSQMAAGTGTSSGGTTSGETTSGGTTAPEGTTATAPLAPPTNLRIIR